MGHRKIERVYLGGAGDGYMLALCTDGTVWVYEGGPNKGAWLPYPLIPGDDLVMRPVLPKGPLESGDVFGHTAMNPDTH